MTKNFQFTANEREPIYKDWLLFTADEYTYDMQQSFAK